MPSEVSARPAIKIRIMNPYSFALIIRERPAEPGQLFDSAVQVTVSACNCRSLSRKPFKLREGLSQTRLNLKGSKDQKRQPDTHFNRMWQLAARNSRRNEIESW